MLKTARSYVHSSGQNTGTWLTYGQTDRRMDRQTDILWLVQRSALRAMRTRCKNLQSTAFSYSVCVWCHLVITNRNCRPDAKLYLPVWESANHYWWINAQAFLTFCAPVTLTLTRWLSGSYRNLTRIAWRYVQIWTSIRQGFRKLSIDRQTDRIDRSYKPRRFAGGQNYKRVNGKNNTSRKYYLFSSPWWANVRTTK